MLNRNIHIAYDPGASCEKYFIANKQTEYKRINSAEDIIASTSRKNSKRIYFILAGVDTCVMCKTIERRPDGSMKFPYAEIKWRKFDLTPTQQSEVLNKGFVKITSDTYAFIDLVAYKNFVFSTMNYYLDLLLKQEVARERADRNADRMWTELENKDFGTTPSGEKQHTIDEYLTSDDEWWLSLNDETKKQIRSEWEG